MWLFDGLDELSPPAGERFYQTLVNLPGLKVVSCRTAVYEIFRREVDRYKEQEYELLGLKFPDQHAFLTHALNGDARRAKVLHHRLQHNSQLRLLAGNPLMLSLIAQASDPMALPATRSAFYQEAVSELWRRRLDRHPDADFRTRERDQVLTELAERMGMAQIQAPLAWLEEAANHVAGPDGRSLMRYLQHAGIVRPHSWGNMVMDVNTPPSILKKLAQDTIEPIRQFIAANPSTLPDTLARLTRHANPHIRWQAARHPSTPPETLTQLAQDTGSHVRQGTLLDLLARWAGDIHRAVAGNPGIPPEVRAQLAQDTEQGMHRTVTGEPSAPPEATASLASHADPNMRQRAAINLNTPSETLAHLAQDVDRFVRRAVAANPNTSPDILTQLAQDADTNVHWGVAMNPSTLLEDL